MKIGIIYTAFNTEEYVDESLAPWVDAREAKLGGHEFVICAVSLPFAGFDTGPRDQTQYILRDCLDTQSIDHLITEPENIPETTARGMALQWLRGQGCDVSWMVDSDEFYDLGQIERILSFVETRPDVAWFRLCLKNYVFDNQTYLTEPFTPPRVHRLDLGGYAAHSFSQDNDVVYGGRITRDLKPQEAFASVTVPKGVAWMRHLSWMNDDRARRKQAYQVTRWGRSDFAWDDIRGLIWRDGVWKETATDE